MYCLHGRVHHTATPVTAAAAATAAANAAATANANAAANAANAATASPLCESQLMAVGGNGKARQFFKQHGWDEVG